LWKESNDNRGRIECKEIKVKELQSKTGQKNVSWKDKKGRHKNPQENEIK